MAKISLQMSYTLDFVNKTVSFGKIDARIDEIDLDEDVKEQLKSFDSSMDDVTNHLRTYLKSKVSNLLKPDEKSKV
jgi:hypothetical protein